MGTTYVNTTTEQGYQLLAPGTTVGDDVLSGHAVLVGDPSGTMVVVEDSLDKLERNFAKLLADIRAAQPQHQPAEADMPPAHLLEGGRAECDRLAGMLDQALDEADRLRETLRSARRAAVGGPGAANTDPATYRALNEPMRIAARSKAMEAAGRARQGLADLFVTEAAILTARAYPTVDTLTYAVDRDGDGERLVYITSIADAAGNELWRWYETTTELGEAWDGETATREALASAAEWDPDRDGSGIQIDIPETLGLCRDCGSKPGEITRGCQGCDSDWRALLTENAKGSHNPAGTDTTQGETMTASDTTTAGDADDNRHGLLDDDHAIRLFLDLSTAHLPERYSEGLLGAEPGVTAYPFTHGWLMWVPDDPDDSSAAMDEPVPDEILAIQRYARQRDCDYVMFDRDADRVAGLPTWEW